MYSSIHSLAHRAPASRTRVRWQPYGSLAPSTSASSISKSPSSTCPNSPSSSAPSSPISAPQCDADPPKQIQSTPQPQSQQPQKDKNKYALGLVDQAVKSLCEIWRPQDVPPVFLTTSRCTNNQQTPSVSQPPSLFATGDTAIGTSNLVPMKGFVHEVLRRSRTSGSVLQTALCYLEAIRPRISEIAQADDAFKGETELADRITVATEAELAREAEFCVGTDTIIINESDDSMDTIRLSDTTSYSGSTAVYSGLMEDNESTLAKAKSPSTTLAPLPPLPSPLLCPRRAFLASLILASKFTQDKCYSNRAWAKLSGLPPREIGRCERALGDALDWRLWVGKSSPQSQGTAPPSPPVPSARPLSRCRSESSIPASPVESAGFLSATSSDKCTSSTLSTSPPSCSPEVGRSAGLRRAVTLPTEAFAFSVDKHTEKLSNSSWNRVTQSANYGTCKSYESLDADMHSPDALKHSSNCAVAEICNSDNSPPTPGLSYSPTSTESSSGDRTIQMPCFFDDKGMVAADGSSTNFSGIPPETLSWFECSPAGQIAVTPFGQIVGAMQESHFLTLPSIAPFALLASNAAVLDFESKISPSPTSLPRPVLTYQ
jgi:PHO85 cyclin-5